jgi:hypothetical protein
MQAMRHFMSGFFLILLFKLLSKVLLKVMWMYDVLAKKFQLGIPVCFIELGLRIAFLINFNPILNSLTVVVMEYQYHWRTTGS